MLLEVICMCLHINSIATSSICARMKTNVVATSIILAVLLRIPDCSIAGGSGGRGHSGSSPSQSPSKSTYSFHCSSFWGLRLPFRILSIDLVKPGKGTRMETLGTSKHAASGGAVCFLIPILEPRPLVGSFFIGVSYCCPKGSCAQMAYTSAPKYLYRDYFKAKVIDP